MEKIYLKNIYLKKKRIDRLRCLKLDIKNMISKIKKYNNKFKIKSKGHVFLHQVFYDV